MARSGKFSGKFSAKQAEAIQALMTSRDVRGASVACGVAYRTLNRWLTLPDFQAALKAAEGAAIETAIRRLSQLSGVAVDVLSDVMQADEPGNGARVKVRAAEATLARLLNLKELVDLETRISALEVAQGQGHETNGTSG